MGRISAVRERVADDPSLAWSYLRSALTHRVAGPALSRWRPGAVAIFHIGRCGSTVLTDQLDQHPRVSWDGESYVRVFEDMRVRGQDRKTSGFDPAAYILDRLPRSGRSWFGFDLKFFHVTEFGVGISDYLDLLEEGGVTHFVSLQRTNYLRKVVSTMNGARRGEYHNRAGSMAALPALHIDPHNVALDIHSGTLVEIFERWDAWYDELTRWGAQRQLLTLTYEEDLERDPSLGYRKVVDFLGEKPVQARVGISRSNPEPLDQLVENLDEVRAHLASTPWPVRDT